MRWLAILAIVSACKFDPPGAASADDAAGPDDAAKQLDSLDAFVLGDWGTPTLVAELNSLQNDDDPTLTGDLLEIYFASTRLPDSADEDIYVATRASVATAFGTPVLEATLSSIAFDSNVDISADGLTIVFSSNRLGGIGDLFFSERAARGSPWSNPALLPGANSAGGEWGAVLSPDLLKIVECSDRAGNEALYAAERASSGVAFGAPVQIAGLDTIEQECDGMLADPDTLYFTRGQSAAAIDLYVAKRNGAAFDHVTPITVLNTAGRDGDPWVSADQRTLFFASNRAGLGPDDIYISTR